MRMPIFFLVIVVISLSSNAFSDDSLLSVSDEGFAYHATPRTDLPASDRLTGKVTRQIPLYFWTKVVGDEQALQYMRTVAKLPVRHLWSVRCATTPDAANADVNYETEEDIFVGHDGSVNAGKWEDLLDKLQSEISSNRENGRPATFDWRTQSMKMALKNCRYSVVVEDDRGRVLRCTDIGSACRVSITLGGQ